MPAVRRFLRWTIDTADRAWLSRRPGTELREQDRAAWQGATPDSALTWGRELSGDAFIRKAVEYGLAGTVLEVGPGYGRLLDSALRLEVPFERWVGFDLSPDNVRHLQHRFPSERFVVADAETEPVTFQVDTIVSSLTLKHVFPSFERLLKNVVAALKPGGVVIVDLIEGRHLRHFERSRGNFIRSYSRHQVRDIFERCGLDARFDYVDHDAEHRRLLAVGTKP